MKPIPKTFLIQLRIKAWISVFSLLLLVGSCTSDPQDEMQALPVKQWHRASISFVGPETSEQAEENPFLDYRLNVTFKHKDKTYVVPGHYAADGNAGETSGDSGNFWRVYFSPDEVGEWTYEASFRKGSNIAVSNDPNAGEPVAFDGISGKLEVTPSDKELPDFRAKGRLNYVGERYLQFADGSYFLKGGADSPENMLAYADFDGTYDIDGGDPDILQEGLHVYGPHIGDWNEGDPTWKDNKGKGLIGGLNYLSGKGVNSVYFLTMNIGGDGRDTWPYTSHEVFDRFDVSKLDQWETVFSHAQSKGIMLHFVTQETENETLLDDGDVGTHRALYYRELISRFGHHLAITWNMGEENGPAHFSPDGQSTAQQKAMTDYFEKHDPYGHFTVIHTHSMPDVRKEMFEALLGHPTLDGPSFQMAGVHEIHGETVEWLEKSKEAGKQWVCCQDEIGRADRGAVPDADYPSRDSLRHEVLWANLMAGGAGVEWYFGYKYAHNDLNLEDWRSREILWDQTTYATRFFQKYLRFWEMENADELIASDNAWCFAKPNETYAVYIPPEETGVAINLPPDQSYSLRWFDPRNGGDLQEGEFSEMPGGDAVSLGSPPDSPERDWVALIKLKN